MLVQCCLQSISCQVLPIAEMQLQASIQTHPKEHFDLEGLAECWLHYLFGNLFDAFYDPKTYFSGTNICPYDPIFPSSYQLLNPAYALTFRLKFLNPISFLKFLVFRQNKKWIHGCSINLLPIRFHNHLVNFHFQR